MAYARQTRHTSVREAVRCLCGAAALLAGAAGAWAQTAAVADESQGLDEVVVTAERRTQSLQDVPIAATVFDNQQIIEKGVLRLEDLQNEVPAVSIKEVGGDVLVNIRGVGEQFANQTSSPGVAFYQDGAVIPNSRAVVGTFYDVAGIEVLRGPQGTLVGQNSTGGAIFVRSTQPSLDGYNAYVDQTIGNYGERKTEGAFNLPLADGLALRIAGLTDTRNSFTTNTGAGDGSNPPSQPGNVDTTGARIQLMYKPNEQLEADLRYEYFKFNTDGPAIKPLNDPAGPSPFVIGYNSPTAYRLTGNRIDGEIKYFFNDGIEIRSLSDYQGIREFDLTDQDMMRNVDNALSLYSASHSMSEEINVVSPTDGAFHWVAGYFYLDRWFPLDLPIFADGVQAVRIDTGNASISQSIFGQASYAITSAWELTVGARYTWDRADLVGATYAGPFVIPTAAPSRSSEPTGKAAINWKPASDTLIYLSYARGYKAGGANSGGFAPFAPETNQVEELGFKTSVLNNHLRLDADIFDSQYDNIQLQNLVNQLPDIQNAAKAKSYGAELEATAQFGDLSFNLGTAYLKNYTTVESSLFDSRVPGNVSIPSGTEVPYAPRVTANVGAQYAFHVGGGKLTPRLQYSYQAEQWVLLFHNPLDLQPSYSTLDARLMYEPKDSLHFELYSTNVANKVYIAGIASASNGAGATGYTYGAPRQFGGRFIYHFH